jgi:hypothetical protein
MAFAGRTSVSAYGITFPIFLAHKYYFSSDNALEHKCNDAVAKKVREVMTENYVLDKL